MKALVCLAAFLITLGSAHAIDNMVKGENFDGETGLKTGAQLEDLVTESYWSSGAFATNNAIRLFDASQFELGTDTTGITGTNVATIKAGGITTTEILDGTIGTNDVNAEFISLLAGTDYGVSRLGYTLLTIATNQITSVKNGGTLVTNFDNTVDKNWSTRTSQAALDHGGQSDHAYFIDLGAEYSGIAELKVFVYPRANIQFQLSFGSSLTPISSTSAVIDERHQTFQWTGMNAATSTNTFSYLFTGRYVAWGFGNTATSAGHRYHIYEMAFWGVTNSYDNIGGF